jgi:HSP20 family molecular chaperone IbpA
MHIQTGTGPSGRGQPLDRPVLAPRVDIYENDTEVLLSADLPGVADDAVRLHLERNELILEAATSLPEAEGEAVAHEFGNVEYRRVFLVPKGIDAERIAAELKNGVLRVRLPKTSQVQPRRIPISAS